MIEQLTRYFVPLKDDMSKFEELCDRKRLKKRDIAIIFESLDINNKTMSEVLKARLQAQKPQGTQAQKPQGTQELKKKRKNRMEVMMWTMLATSILSMLASITVLLGLAFG